MVPLAQVRALLRRLDGASADAIESESLECRSWDPHPRARESQIRDLREAVVAFANARGGTIIVGVADRRRTRGDAIQGVGDLPFEPMRKAIYDGTEPHILVSIEELIEPEGRLLLIHVPRGMPPHFTTEGVGKVRVEKDCRPITSGDISRLLFAGGQRDFSAEALPGATFSVLDPDEIRRLRRMIESEGGKKDLVRLKDKELLQALDLVRDDEVTLAAVLLVGRSTALARWIPQHELIFLRIPSQARYDNRHDLKGPLLAVLERVRTILEPLLQLRPVEARSFQEVAVPDLTTWTAREAVLNALVHRDFFVREGVQVSLYGDRLEVASPGGFLGGVRPENILRHKPVRRNPLLAGALQTIGLVNRAGLGVDRIYDEMLRYGKQPPRYTADEASVHLVLPLKSHPAFVQFVAEETAEGRQLELDDLIVLRAVVDRGRLDRWSAEPLLQLPEEDAAVRLAMLRERGYLVAQGRGRSTCYRLARPYSDRLRGPAETDRDLPLDDEAVRLRLVALLQERGRLTNADARRVSGYPRTEVRRTMAKLVEAGVAALVGRGRGAHYVPGPRAKATGPRKGPRS